VGESRNIRFDKVLSVCKLRKKLWTHTGADVWKNNTFDTLHADQWGRLNTNVINVMPRQPLFEIVKSNYNNATQWLAYDKIKSVRFGHKASNLSFNSHHSRCQNQTGHTTRCGKSQDQQRNQGKHTHLVPEQSWILWLTMRHSMARWLGAFLWYWRFVYVEKCNWTQRTPTRYHPYISGLSSSLVNLAMLDSFNGKGQR